CAWRSRRAPGGSGARTPRCGGVGRPPRPADPAPFWSASADSRSCASARRPYCSSRPVAAFRLPWSVLRCSVRGQSPLDIDGGARVGRRRDARAEDRPDPTTRSASAVRGRSAPVRAERTAGPRPSGAPSVPPPAASPPAPSDLLAVVPARRPVRRRRSARIACSANGRWCCRTFASYPPPRGRGRSVGPERLAALRRTAGVRWLGRVVTRRRRWVIALALAFLPVAGIVGGSVERHLSAGGFDDPSSDPGDPAQLLRHRFHSGEPNLVLLVTARSGSVGAPAVASAGTALTGELAARP